MPLGAAPPGGVPLLLPPDELPLAFGFSRTSRAGNATVAVSARVKRLMMNDRYRSGCDAVNTYSLRAG